jgi:Acetyltransferase (GNAT) family
MSTPAFILDTAVLRRSERQGVGTRLVALATEHARAAGCQWLHVDFDKEGLRRLYFDACGLRPTIAGLIDLLDGKQLVLLGHETDELAREGGDLPDAERLEAPFRAHGYPLCQAVIPTRTSTGAGWRTCPTCPPGPTPSSRREPGRWTEATRRTPRSSVGSWASSASWSATRAGASSGDPFGGRPSSRTTSQRHDRRSGPR